MRQRLGRSLPHWVALAAVLGSATGEAAGTAAPPTIPCDCASPLPAYAHNDYENPRPLLDALQLGYLGVEADVHLVAGQLLVAHDRSGVRRGRTLEALYLAPLREHWERCGNAFGQRPPFLLNVELKSGSNAAYIALCTELLRYQDLLTVVRDGVARPGLVQVVLVGWHPPLEELARETTRLVAVQWKLSRPGQTPPDAPAHLVALVSLDFGKCVRWSGRGAAPASAKRWLRELIAARDAVPGRRARTYNLPLRPAAYHLVRSAGVDLIGTKQLRRSRALLTATP